MHETFLESREDLDWLFEVHLRTAPPEIKTRTVCAILWGNEDWPHQVQVFDRNHFKAKPIYVWPNPYLAVRAENEDYHHGCQPLLGKDRGMREYELSDGELFTCAGCGKYVSLDPELNGKDSPGGPVCG